MVVVHVPHKKVETIVPGTENTVLSLPFPGHSKEMMQTFRQHPTFPAQNAAEINNSHCNCSFSH